MEILGDVNNGWYARLARGCESAGRGTLNFVSCGKQWGDRLYGTMDAAAARQADSLNRNAINQAIRNGATQQQALQAGSDQMGRLANPRNAGDLGELASAGASTAGQTLRDLAGKGNEGLGALVPILIGAGVIGGVYLLADNSSGDAPKPSSRRKER